MLNEDVLHGSCELVLLLKVALELLSERIIPSLAAALSGCLIYLPGLSKLLIYDFILFCIIDLITTGAFVLAGE